jgi:hypothetical protein
MGDVILNTTTLPLTLTAIEIRRMAEAMRQIAERGISLTPALGLWVASRDIKGVGHNRKRALASVSAIGTTPMAAISALLANLDVAPQGREMFDVAPDFDSNWNHDTDR